MKAALRAIALVPIAAATLGAQQVRALPPAGPGIIAGVVTDTSGRSIDGASVFLQARNREVRTRADGQFRFDGLNTGDTVTVVARRLGYFPLSARVPIGEQGRQIMFQLRPRITSLPTVVTEAEFTGVSGVVTDTLMRPIKGAAVQVIGSASGLVKTDADGAFSLQISPGSYMLRVTESNYLSEAVGLNVPARGGRKVSVRMVPGRDPYRNREAMSFDMMRDRILRASGASSGSFTREDIARLNPRDVASLVGMGVKGRANESCGAILNGRYWEPVPLWAIEPEEIEFVAAFGKAIDMGNVRQPRGRTSINGGGTRLPGYDNAPSPHIGGSACPVGGVWIWTNGR